ncbi:hypothetical protein ABPG72_016272 [Tetrahymena utriculariae]
MEINKAFLQQLKLQNKNKNIFELNESDDDIDECCIEIVNHNQNNQQVKEISKSDIFEELKKTKELVLEVSKERTTSSSKSSIILEIKPYSDEIDLSSFANCVFEKVRVVGLEWQKETKILPIAFGLKKLQVRCIIEDDKVSVDDLMEKIIELEEVSVDLFSFCKI